MKKPYIANIAANDSSKFLKRYGFSFVLIQVLFFILIISVINKFPEDYDNNLLVAYIKAFFWSSSYALILLGTANGIRICFLFLSHIITFAKKHHRIFYALVFLFPITTPIFSAVLFSVGALTLIPLFVYHLSELLKMKTE